MEYHVPSVALAAQTLKLLSRHKYKRCSLKDIAEKLDASPTTCLRVLRTLADEEFVSFDSETKKYSLGPYLIPLGNRAAELNGALARAMAEMQRITASTGLTCALIQRWDDRLVYAASAEPPTERVRLSISTGQQIPLTSGAHGRCFLAFDDDAEWRRLVAAGLHGATAASITEPQRFIEALRETRRNGYAISHGEITPGYTAVDAPIFGKSGAVELVISCMCVTAQMDDERLERITHLLLGAAQKLSEWGSSPARWNGGNDEAPAPAQPITTPTAPVNAI